MCLSPYRVALSTKLSKLSRQPHLNSTEQSPSIPQATGFHNEPPATVVRRFEGKGRQCILSESAKLSRQSESLPACA